MDLDIAVIHQLLGYDCLNRDGEIFVIKKGKESKLTKAEEKKVIAEQERRNKEWDDTQYQRDRAREYPKIEEYLDAVVKGDDEEIKKYIDKCLEVKKKYPKPE